MILVTGATGDVGGEVTRQLVRAGAKVRVLARDPAKAAKLGLDVEIAAGDLLRPETLEGAFRGVEKVFLMAHAQDLPAAADHAVPAAARAGVRHVVLLSSYTAAHEQPSAIGRWHRAAEVTLEGAGLAWTMLRPGNFASNTLRWAGTIKAQGAVYAPEGSGRTAPIDPQDIASVGARALLDPGHEGKRYLLTGEEMTDTAGQVATLAAALGRELRLVTVPPAAARAGMLKGGLSETLADAVLELTVGPYAREEHFSKDVRAVTGAPARSYAQWVEAHLDAFR
jgi:uncharacterized protein YbjT (DUF2867 family)